MFANLHKLFTKVHELSGNFFAKYCISVLSMSITFNLVSNVDIIMTFTFYLSVHLNRDNRACWMFNYTTADDNEVSFREGDFIVDTNIIRRLDGRPCGVYRATWHVTIKLSGESLKKRTAVLVNIFCFLMYFVFIVFQYSWDLL